MAPFWGCCSVTVSVQHSPPLDIMLLYKHDAACLLHVSQV